MVGLLAAYNISPDVDENGKEIPINVAFEAGAIRYANIDLSVSDPRSSLIGTQNLTVFALHRDTVKFLISFH